MPTILQFNARSLFPKISSLVTNISERAADICFVTEIWEQLENRKHQHIIEELLEMKGIKYIITPRRCKRGGGAAIAVNLARFTISKLHVNIPSRVETVWGLLKPKDKSCIKTSFIVCCFYSPPDRNKNIALINHLNNTLQSLLNIHTNDGILICGDRNHMEISSLTDIEPSLMQTVMTATYGSKILDVVCTNLSTFYNSPNVAPPLLPDYPLVGAPSDHLGVLVTPIRSEAREKKRKKMVKDIRPLPESLLGEFRI